MELTEQERREEDSRFAHARLDSLLQKRAVLRLILEEAGVAILTDETLVKTCNIRANQGITAERALTRVIAKHLFKG